jgi:hypothetical protein
LNKPVKDVQRLNELGHGIHGDAGRKYRHGGEGKGVEGAGLFVKAQPQVFRHGARARAVIKGHHENPDKDHCRNSADPIKVAGGDSILGSRRSHPDHFLRAKIGGNKREAANPSGNRTAGKKEIGTGPRVSLQCQADAQHKDEIDDHDDPINRSQHE